MSGLQKKILILGGTYFQIPVIKYAKSKGYYVITCDYLPDNPGHIFADEYHNISTTDQEAVLQLAAGKKINGILAYASDPAALTAAYVGSRLGLPSNPYNTVHVLTNKEAYRTFLKKNGFLAPRHIGAYSLGDIDGHLSELCFPVMVKPVDSSGSKGVTKLATPSMLSDAFLHAMKYSRGKQVIIEEFVQRMGPQIGGEAFILDGKVICVCLGDQLVDQAVNPYVPAGMLFPSELPPFLQQEIFSLLQQLVDASGFRFGGVNLEIMRDHHDGLYLMEVGPRTGGNFLPELVSYFAGMNFAKCSVEASMGHSISFALSSKQINIPPKETCYAYYAIHSSREGILRNINIDPCLEPNILEKHYFKKGGDPVEIYNGSNCTLGILLLRFLSQSEMQQKVSKIGKYVRLELE